MPANLGLLGEVLVGVKFGMEQALRELNQLEQRVDRAGRNIQDDLETPAKRGAAGLTTAFRTAASAAAAFGVALSVREVVEMADAASLIRARLQLVTGSAQGAQAAFADLSRIALETRSSFGETAGLYTTLANATSDLGVSSDLLLEVTDNVNKALIVSGTNAQSAQAALYQLSQAMGAGVLRGEELNSVLFQARPLAEAIAKELGVNVGQLKALGEQGKITSDVVLAAFVNMGQGADNVEDKFAKMPVTIGQAFTNVANSVQLLIAAFDGAAGASAGVAGVINQMAIDLASATDEVALLGATIAAVVGPLNDFWTSIAPASLTSFSDFIKTTRKEIEGIAGLFGVEIAQAAEPVDVIKQDSVDRATDFQAQLAQIAERAKAIAPATKASSDALDEAADRAADYRKAIEDLEFEAEFAGQSEDVREFALLLKDLGVQATVTASQASGLEDLLTIGTPTGVEEAERLLEVFKRMKEAEAAAEAVEQFADGMADLRSRAQITGLPEEVAALGEALQNLGVGFEVQDGSIIPIRPEDAERIAAVRTQLEGIAAAEGAAQALRDARDASASFAEGLADIRAETNLAGVSDQVYELAQALQSLNVPFTVQDGSIIPIRAEDAQRIAQVRQEIEGLSAAREAADATRAFNEEMRYLRDEAQLEGLSGSARELARTLQDLGIAFQIQPQTGQFVGATQVEQERITQIQAQIDANRQLELQTRYVEQAQRSATDATNTLFEDIVFRSEDAGDALENFAKQIARDFVSQAIFQPISQGIGALLGGVLGMFNPFGFLAGGLFGGFAKGGIFDKGKLVPFGRGGLIDQPTVFPMAKGDVGLMGESGTEAVIPLRRGADGALGVAAEGIGSTVINFSPAIDARGAAPGAGQDVMRSIDQAYNIFKQRMTNDLRRNPGTRASAGIRKG